MKKTIGLITLLLISQYVVAEEIPATQAEAVSPEAEAPAAITETEATTTAKTTEIKEQSGFSRGSVVRSAFTTKVEDREPAENLQKLSNDKGKVMFFTELRDMSGQTAIHRWEHAGKVVAEVEFNVKGPRWRVWSSKNLMPQATGDWKVSVINAAGEVISEKNLSYEVAEAPASESQPEQSESAISTESEPTPVQ